MWLAGVLTLLVCFLSLGLVSAQLVLLIFSPAGLWPGHGGPSSDLSGLPRATAAAGGKMLSGRYLVGGK